MLINIRLFAKFQLKAFSTTCYITNRLQTKALQGKTPFEALNKRKLEIFNLYIYGCDAYIIDYKAKIKDKIVLCLQGGTFIDYEAKNQ